MNSFSLRSRIVPTADDRSSRVLHRGDMTKNRQIIVRAAAALLAASCLAVGVAGCASPSGLTSQSVWMPTYTISVTGGETIADVEYDSGQKEVLNRTRDGVQKLERGVDASLSWHTRVPVTAMRAAYVAATPQPGFTATCTITVGGEEIVAHTGAPGARVICQKPTPAMD